MAAVADAPRAVIIVAGNKPASGGQHIQPETEALREDLHPQQIGPSAAGIEIKRRFGRIPGYFLGGEKAFEDMLPVFFYYTDTGICNFKLHVLRRVFYRYFYFAFIRRIFDRIFEQSRK